MELRPVFEIKNLALLYIRAAGKFDQVMTARRAVHPSVVMMAINVLQSEAT